MNRIARISLLLIVVLAAAAPAAQPTEVKAVFRDGQTFITWKESGAESYKVWRAAKPVADVKTAVCVATVAKDSGAYPLEVQRKVAAKYAGKPGYNARYIIEDNPAADPAKMLAEGVGLFVYTPHEGGSFHYAVTAGDDTSVADGNRTAAGVAEKEEPIGAVLVYKADVKDKEGKVVGDQRIYCHWMDAADWNPKPTGGYAFNFGVGVPVDKKTKGICMFLHGYSGYYETRGPTEAMVTIVPGDPHQSWFYGYLNEAGDKVVNYTERRMLLTIDTVDRLLKREGVSIDMNKVYTHGGSMGGTGANFLGARYGNVFAAMLASKGAVDHNRNGNWTADAERLLGPRDKNIPTNAGPGAWDWQNLIKWHADHVAQETAFMLDAHASNDESVPFGAVPEYYKALQAAKRPFAAVWAPWGHGGFEDPHWPNHLWWGTFQFNKDESVPAIGNASSSDEPKPGGRGEINTHIEWSARENDFDKTSDKDNLVDQADRWEIQLRSCNYHRTQSQKKDVDKQTADVTPRRYQKFKAAPGQEFTWENWSYADPAAPAKVAEGVVKADKYGLVTVEKFEINKAGWGNRLVIKAR